MRHVIAYCIFISLATNGDGQSDEIRKFVKNLASRKLFQHLSHFNLQNNNEQRNSTEVKEENNKEEDTEPVAHNRAQEEELDAVENIEDDVQDASVHKRNGYEQDGRDIDQNYYYEEEEKEYEQEEKDVHPYNDEGGEEVGEAVEYEESEEFRERAAELVSSPTTVVQVNMEELAERVKKKILMDLKREAQKEQRKKTKNTKPSNKHLVSTTKQRPSPQRDARMQTKNSKKRKPMKPMRPAQHVLPNRQDPQKQPKNVSKEYIEQTELFDTVKLHSKGKKDLYADYVIPPKEYDAYESEETTPSKPNNQKPRQYKSPVRIQKSKPVRNGETQTGADSRVKNRPQNYESRQIKTTRRYLKKPTSQYRYQKGIMNHQIPQRDDVDGTETTTDIYEYDGVTKKRTTPELKAMTQNIGGPSEEDTQVKNFDNQAGADQKKHVGTDIPTRQTYKMTSPDYYHSLPRVAEKYNFDEPIPEKDREYEEIRPIYNNPGAMINKKVKVN